MAISTTVGPAITVTAAKSTTTQTPVIPYQGYVSALYSDPEVWLCWPGANDVCKRDQTTTAIYADGTTEIITVDTTSDPLWDPRGLSSWAHGKPDASVLDRPWEPHGSTDKQEGASLWVITTSISPTASLEITQPTP